MTKTVRIRARASSGGGPLMVRVMEVDRVSGRNAPVVDRTVLAEGQTDAAGEWQFDETLIPPRRLVTIGVFDPATGELLEETPPATARQLPGTVDVNVERPTASLPGQAAPDPAPSGPTREPEPDTPSAPHVSSPRRSYTDILASALQRDNVIRDAEAQVIGVVVQNSFQRRRTSGDFAGQLLGQKPLRSTPAPHFVPMGVDPTARLSASVTDGLSRISDAATGTNHGLTVRPGPIADLLPVAGGPIPPDIADEVLASVMPGNATRRQAGPLERCMNRKRASDEIARLQASEAPDDTATQTDKDAANRSEPVSAPNALEQEPTADDGVASRPTVQDIAASLQTQVPGGPADSISHYDYSSLQIAWENTWTGMVDADLKDQVRDLYDTVVQTMPQEVNVAALAEELGELDDIAAFLDGIEDAAAAVGSTILTDTQLSAWIPEISDKWHILTPSERDKLGFLYDVHVYVEDFHTVPLWDASLGKHVDSPNNNALSDVNKFSGYPVDWLPSDLTVHTAYALQWAEKEAHVLLDAAPETTGPRIGRVDELITDLKTRIADPYQFDVFVPDSYNYGLLVTYRQQWRPLSYQAGDLAGSIALAPNETRRYSTRRKQSRSASTRREETTSSLEKSGSEETARSEGEIMRRAQSSLSASADASVGLNFGITFSGGGEFTSDQGSESNQTKRDISETTFTAAQEYRDERKVEITQESASETETTEEREISNPNNELTVTYLFYELQRRFEVSERLYDVQPVVMVAFHVPAPHEINETWLLEHEWILRKVLLDRSLHPVLRMLSEDFAGDELAVEVYEEQWKTQVAVVAELHEQLEGHSALREEARAAIVRAAAAARSAAEEAETDQGAPWKDVAMVAVGGVGALLADQLFKELTDDPAVPATASDESARDALDWANSDMAAAQAALRSGVSALETATERYVGAVRDRLNRRVRVDKLILHVKANILHYMQAIWHHEHPDQRYLRVYDLEIAWPSWNGVFTYAPSVVPISLQRSAPQMSGTFEPQPMGTLNVPEMSLAITKKLHQVADLSKILGFKGNYAIFALREQNALTTTMAVDYLDTEFGVSDPDPSGDNLTAEEAIALAECAWTEAGATEDDKQDIAEWLMATLEKAHNASQEIIVPTGEMFIEALPGTHTLLEDFKLKHRAADAARAAAEAQAAEFEAMRRAARLRAADLDDPDVDKRIEIHGGTPGISVNSD